METAMKNVLRHMIATALVTTFAHTAVADKIVLLDNNAESLQARADYIQGAQELVRAQYFTIENDSLSRSALALLRDAASRDVKVKILVDSMHNLILRETMAAVMLNLHPDKKKNIEIKEYNTFNLFRPFRYSKRMHDKGLIIDGKYMISGGRNIANGYYGVPDTTKRGEALPVYEDSDALVLDSKSIEVAAKYFDDLWNSKFVTNVALYDFSVDNLSPWACAGRDDQQNCEYSREQRVKKVAKEEKTLDSLIAKYKSNKMEIQYQVTDWNAKAIEVQSIDFLFDDVTKQNSRLDKPENSIGTQLYNAITKAKESVIIITPYLVITPEQEALFKILKEKEVEVTIITNSKGSNDVPAANVGYDKTKQLAINAGVTILEYQGPDTLHAKMVLLDRSTIFIGSFNWDFRSQNLNREVGILAELPANQKNDLTNDLVRKFAAIMKKTCKIGAKICNVSRGETLEKLDPEQYEALVTAFKMREQNSGTLYRILFPLIKGQL